MDKLVAGRIYHVKHPAHMENVEEAWEALLELVFIDPDELHFNRLADSSTRGSPQASIRRENRHFYTMVEVPVSELPKYVYLTYVYPAFEELLNEKSI